MVKAVKIVKMNGHMDDYSRSKLLRSCERAGASSELCSMIADHVENKLYDGMPTRDILSIIHRQLRNAGDTISAVRYKLKEAIAKQDPELHEFEFFITRLLKYEGYDTEHSPEPKIQGDCIDHEIDVVARKGKMVAIVECKHHYRDHTFTGLDTPMRQWARLDDISCGYNMKRRNSIDATTAWVVTNTKYSFHAVGYSKCKGVKLLGWNYPPRDGLNEMIERHRAYPLTLLGFTRNEREKLLMNNIFNVLDFLDADTLLIEKIGIDGSRVLRVKNQIERLIN